MLAYLTEEQPTIHEQASLDPTLGVPAPDDQGAWARVAYEAAHDLASERWTPRRRQRAGARRCEAPA